MRAGAERPPWVDHDRTSGFGWRFPGWPHPQSPGGDGMMKAAPGVLPALRHRAHDRGRQRLEKRFDVVGGNVGGELDLVAVLALLEPHRHELEKACTKALGLTFAADAERETPKVTHVTCVGNATANLVPRGIHDEPFD